MRQSAVAVLVFIQTRNYSSCYNLIQIIISWTLKPNFTQRNQILVLDFPFANNHRRRRRLYATRSLRAVGTGGGKGGDPDFGRSFSPIPTRGGRLCPPHNTTRPPHGFSDLPTVLSLQRKKAQTLNEASRF